MMAKAGRGKFITFEGPEGAGKSSQIRHLRGRLAAAGLEVVVSREPGGTELAERLRKIVKHYDGEERIVDETELLLFAASRAQHVGNLIIPSLDNGVTVLCDRFADSTTAYQGYARGLDLKFIKRLNDYVIRGCVPDLTILLDLPPETGFERTTARQALLFKDVDDRIEGETIDFHQRVRDGFLTIAQAEPGRISVLDATRAEAEVTEAVWKLVEERCL